MSVVIFGQGFVGQATAIILGNDYIFHDPYKGSIVEDFSNVEYAVICVPTPESDYGLDHTEVINCLELLKDKKFQGITVIRSTCHPLVLHQLENLYGNIIFWPEFLRELTFQDDAVNPHRVILGGNFSATDQFAKFLKLKEHAKTVTWSHIGLKEAAMIKLGTNFALAAKVITFNLLYEACEKNGISWNIVKNGVAADPRIGQGQTVVPGPDGQFGFGGKCLPKDAKTIEHLVDDKSFVKSLLLYNSNLRKKASDL
jgi:UDP-glucose 6-dehydrogenase